MTRENLDVMLFEVRNRSKLQWDDETERGPKLATKQEWIYKLFHQLSREHGLGGWRLEVIYHEHDHEKWYGLTIPDKKLIRIETFFSNRHTRDTTREVLLHEICHALAGDKAYAEQHNEEFQKRLIAMGGTFIGPVIPDTEYATLNEI